MRMRFPPAGGSQGRESGADGDCAVGPPAGPSLEPAGGCGESLPQHGGPGFTPEEQPDAPPYTRGAMVPLRASEVRQLLHNKFVVVLGDSVQRAVYKDLVLLLQKDSLLSLQQLKAKGELSFEQDTLLEGGQLDTLHNGITYREVRQYLSGHHLVRFYFLTRVYSKYLQSVLEQLQAGEHAPDLVIMNSCLWDLSRYGPESGKRYLKNLAKLFAHLGRVLPPSCLLVWNTAMPVGHKITASFLPPEDQPYAASLRIYLIEANFYCFAEARKHGFDLLDLHFHFRHASQHRHHDGVHWNARAHRCLSYLLLAHVADAWGVELPHRPAVRWLQDGPTRGQRGRGVHRRHPTSRDTLAQPLTPPRHAPLLPFSPPPPLLPAPSLMTLQTCPVPPYPMVPPFPLCSQDSYFTSDHPFQMNPFCFSPDASSPTQTGFVLEANLTFDGQPPVPSVPSPYVQCQAPVVHRGFPRNHPYGPYKPWRGRPRHPNRRTPTSQSPNTGRATST
ncbi:PC-esterase domain-containing protein 1B isoform X1 [Ochotona princeps]|uniref:PC-esterase domain-containing protein 1B isoform X1 n=2 Tax=Ochotona princeps TaxID=9978 RepID=UPI00271511B8|nr:PC-esterase domain-containing protein 1B isoform X1 [Ochotona princeps]